MIYDPRQEHEYPELRTGLLTLYIGREADRASSLPDNRARTLRRISRVKYSNLIRIGVSEKSDGCARPSIIRQQREIAVGRRHGHGQAALEFGKKARAPTVIQQRHSHPAPPAHP